mgnify:CR=1 FL=1
MQKGVEHWRNILDPFGNHVGDAVFPLEAPGDATGVAAGDAWDIRGFKKAKNWDGWSSTFIAGEATNRPRMENVPVCLPYPEPLKSGSIYESQTLLRNTYFEKPPAAE